MVGRSGSAAGVPPALEVSGVDVPDPEVPVPDVPVPPVPAVEVPAVWLESPLSVRRRIVGRSGSAAGVPPAEESPPPFAGLPFAAPPDPGVADFDEKCGLSGSASAELTIPAVRAGRSTAVVFFGGAGGTNVP
jgi:hypothetical protein